MEKIIENHYKLYPESGMQDWFKLLYQSEFGNAHLSDNYKYNLEKLVEEISSCISIKSDIEDIGGNFMRVHLGWLAKSGLSYERFVKIMQLSRLRSKGAIDGFWQKVSILENSIIKLSIPISMEEFHSFEKKYHEAGCPLLSHSTKYKVLYSPSYRVICKEYAEKMDLWTQVEKLVNHAKKNKTTINIAIDGMSTAGKTSLSEMFDKLFDCNIIHMDDFFLRKHQRTYERSLQPGGNVDYERFKQEVAINLMSDTGFIYYAYDCRSNLMDEKKAFPKTLNVVEGSYSMHPYFGNIYDIRIFMETDKESQLDRVLKRNGEEMFDRFKDEWIPLENNYIKNCKIKEKCDFIFRT
ncbi:MAG TPA: hypothetical protein PLT91_03835 [Clostridia bacterium]|jgi:uridine kinase|nr:MAG: uridine kinase [Firmicutes bacterium ADurb.Bin146]HOD93301.1 hypothetical protein [Clostridia bacterium]HQM39353.1 hypothetical protein [Clostridia bacterium]